MGTAIGGGAPDRARRCPLGQHLDPGFASSSTNDFSYRHRSNWNPWQVHQAVAAHITTDQQGNGVPTVQSLPDLENRNTTLLGDTTVGTASASNTTNMIGTATNYEAPLLPATRQPEPSSALSGMVPSLTSLPQETRINRYTITAPALLQGTRCYVDASTMPDQ